MQELLYSIYFDVTNSQSEASKVYTTSGGKLCQACNGLLVAFFGVVWLRTVWASHAHLVPKTGYKLEQ